MLGAGGIEIQDNVVNIESAWHLRLQSALCLLTLVIYRCRRWQGHSTIWRGTFKPLQKEAFSLPDNRVRFQVQSAQCLFIANGSLKQRF
jgi:hypothetical protein